MSTFSSSEILARLGIAGATPIGDDSKYAKQVPMLDENGLLDPSFISGTIGLTSVGLSTNASWFTVGNSPLTSNGNLQLNLTSGLTANKLLATPDGMTGTISLRGIVLGDLPGSVTAQGNVFNGNNELLKLTSSALVPTTNLGTGTADSTTFLRGDGTWSPVINGSGTVTSINVIGADSHVTSSGGPITTNGAISVGLNNVAFTDGSYANPSWITSVGWSKISSTPTTTAGYGITDAISTSTTFGGDVTGTVSSIQVINGTHLGAHTIPDSALSTNVPLLNVNNTFSASQNISTNSSGLTNNLSIYNAATGSVAGIAFKDVSNTNNGFIQWNNASNLFELVSRTQPISFKIGTSPVEKGRVNNTGFLGDGSQLTALNGANISTGLIGPARLGTGTANSTTYLRGDNTWQTISGTGTVTSVATGAGLVGGPITTSGTIALASISNQQILGNISGVGATPIGLSLSAVIDGTLGGSNSIGAILTKDNSGLWTRLAPGPSGYVLQTAGTGNIVSWSNDASTLTNINGSNILSGTVPTAQLGSGSASNTTFLRGDNTWAVPPTASGVTSIAMTVPAFLAVTGSPITSSGTLAVSLSGAALPIANGGTGQTTASNAYSVLYRTVSTAIGDLTCGGTSGAPARIVGNTTTTPAVLIQTGNGTDSAGPVWATSPIFSGANITALNASQLTTGTVASARGGAGTVNGILKGNGSGVVSQAVAGTDYTPATSGTSILFGDGSGGTSNVVLGTGLNFSSGVLDGLQTAGLTLLAGNGTGGFTNVTTGSGLSYSSGVLSLTGGGAGVTSVDVSVPSWLISSGGPITSSGTIVISDNSGATLPSYDGSNLFNLYGFNIQASTVPVSAIDAGGTAGATTYLRGDGNWVTPSGGAGITKIVPRVFSSNGTYTPTTGMTYCTIEVVGGGGGAPMGASVAGSGGGGGYARKTVTAATIGSSQTITVGAAGSFSGTTATGGGTSSVGSIVSASGGGAGISTGAIGIGGTGTSGDINISGGAGAGGFTAGSVLSCGPGGSSQYGQGSPIVISTGTINGSSGFGFGAGARGGTTGGIGASGTIGIVIITEYCV